MRTKTVLQPNGRAKKWAKNFINQNYAHYMTYIHNTVHQFSLLWDIETIEFPFVGIDDAYSASNKAYRMMSMHGWSGVALVLFAILSLKSKIILHSRAQLPYDHILQYQLWPSTSHFCVALNQLRCVDAHEQKLLNGCCDCIHK